MVSNLFSGFPVYEEFSPLVPVVCVTPGECSAIHRFYDTSPISPSGRYIGLTAFFFEDRLPKSGDPAQVIVVDLETGEKVYESQTLAWDTQVGAHVQWGESDECLFFNRMSETDWIPYGCKVNIHTGSEIRLDGTVYMVSPDGRYAASPALAKINHVQAGYGVIVPNGTYSENRGISDKDGLFITDTETGKEHMLLSFRSIVDALPDRFSDIDPAQGGFYGFHVKWNPQGTRIMFIIRWKDQGARHNASRNYLITCRPDGTNITLPVDAKLWRGGHHPTWSNDGEHIIMNLVRNRHFSLFGKAQIQLQRIARKLGIRYYPSATRLAFAEIHYKGQMRFLSEKHEGSGHPTISPDNTHILSDAYVNERTAFTDGTVPLRWINIATDQETCLVRVHALPKYSGPHLEWRVDPHPAWSKAGDMITFNGFLEGRRRVFIAHIEDICNIKATPS